MRHCSRWVALLLLVVVAGRVEAQTLQAITSNNPPRVQVFVSGNLREVVGQEGDAAGGTGSLGLRYIGPAYIATGLINVAGSFDTMTSGFGASMLPPANGKGLNAGLIDVRRRYFLRSGDTCRDLEQRSDSANTLRSKRLKVPTNLKTGSGKILCSFSLHGYAGISTSRWAVPSGDSTLAFDVPVWGLGLGGSYTFINRSFDDKDVAMVFDFGFTSRHIRGDLISDARKPLRQAALGTTKTGFYGLEFALALQYQNLTSSLSYYYFFGDHDIDGFSHGQVVAGVSIQASINDWLIGREKE